jgi:nociceptin receptor
MNESLGILTPTSPSDVLDTPILSTPQTTPLPARLQIYAYCYILPIICVIGIVGNSMNISTLASKRLKAVSFIYLRSLAIADLLCMLFVLTFATCELLNYLGFTLTQSFWYGFYQAHFMLSFINWTLATGNLHVVALSLERYVSVVFPMHFRQWNSPTRARKAIFIAYVIPALFYVPYAFAVTFKAHKKHYIIFSDILLELRSLLMV